ncbi:MAG: zinc ABC transporter substrate-binding protein [Paracoccaceae bacterium]
MRIAMMAALLCLSALPARAEVPRVVTDTPVVHALVAQVMEGMGEPVLLLDRGADPHNFQLRPSQAAALSDAELVVWVGPDLTPWLARALAGGADAKETALLDLPGTRLLDAVPGGPRDPHAWLDPRNAATWTDAIAEALAAADPAGAARYRANAAEARAGLVALDANLARRLAPARGRAFAVHHDAYRYFAARYGLTVTGSLASGDAHDPGAAHLSDLETALAGAVCAFPEAGHDPRAIEALAADTGLRLGPPLDPEGRLLDPGPGLYARLMTSLADGILSCTGGS